MALNDPLRQLCIIGACYDDVKWFGFFMLPELSTIVVEPQIHTNFHRVERQKEVLLQIWATNCFRV